MCDKHVHVLQGTACLPEYAAKFTPPKDVSKNNCRAGIKFTKDMIISRSYSWKSADSVELKQGSSSCKMFGLLLKLAILWSLQYKNNYVG